jgi:hypothetical protein
LNTGEGRNDVENHAEPKHRKRYRQAGRQAGNQWQRKDVEGENILRRNREQSRKGNAKV